MQDRKGLNFLAVASMLLVWSWFYRLHHPSPPGIDLRPHVVLGEVLADQAASLLGPGARLVVIVRDPAAFEVPAAEAQVKAFARAVRKLGRQVDETRPIRLDPLRLPGVPPGDFFDLLRAGRPSDVIVSFLGPPVLEPTQRAALKDQRPQVLAVCSGNTPARVDLRELFAQGLLTVAVVSRADAPARAAPGARHGTFVQTFQLITRANLHELPDAAGSRP